MTDYAVILVHTTSHAVQAERVLCWAGSGAKLVPTPRHLSSACGAAVRIAVTNRAASERALHDAKMEIDRIESV
ncbi:MAG: DUF3343 domain-containing protein [Planctomycetota bacterium]